MVQHDVYPMIICMRCITVIELHLCNVSSCNTAEKKKLIKIQKDGFIKFFSGLTGVVVVVEMCSIRMIPRTCSFV